MGVPSQTSETVNSGSGAAPTNKVAEVLSAQPAAVVTVMVIA